jgi:hypothetical protein
LSFDATASNVEGRTAASQVLSGLNDLLKGDECAELEGLVQLTMMTTAGGPPAQNSEGRPVRITASLDTYQSTRGSHVSWISGYATRLY